MDLHTHTTASGHAYSTVTENARSAKEKGLEILGTADHGYGMKKTTSPAFWRNIKVLPRYLEGVRLLKGVETNLLNRAGDLMEEDLLEMTDYVICSLHGACYQNDTGDQEEYTEAIVHALDRHPQITILGHPDDSAYPLDYEQVLLACQRNHVAVEVNNASLLDGTNRINGVENIKTYLGLCREMDLPIICNTDAHFSTLVGDFTKTRALLEELNFPEELVINSSWTRLEEYLRFSL